MGDTREQGGSKGEGRKEAIHAAGRKERNVDAALPALSVEWGLLLMSPLCYHVAGITALASRRRRAG